MLKKVKHKIGHSGWNEVYGVVCPYCGSSELGVYDASDWSKGILKSIYKCFNCGKNNIDVKLLEKQGGR